MHNFKNFGLLIQGPILSQSNNQNLNQNKFDTNNNIEKIINLYGNLFNEIILATWISEKKKISKKLFLSKKLKIIFLKDPGHNPGNELRHFYSSYKGVQNFKKNIKYLIKIRSDQFINLKKSIIFYKKEVVRKKYFGLAEIEPICTFGFWIDRPYSFADFFYIGNKKDLLAFFKAQIKFKDHKFSIKKILWPEGESIRKYGYHIRNKIKIFEEKFFFPIIFESFSMYQYKLPSVIVSKKNLYLWQYLIKNYFTVLPDDIRKKMIWRGKKFNFIDKQSSFSVWKKIEKNYYEELTKQGSFVVKTKLFFDLPNFLLFSRYKKDSLKKTFFTKIFYINHLIYYFVNFICYIYLRLRNYIFKKLF